MARTQPSLPAPAAVALLAQPVCPARMPAPKAPQCCCDPPTPDSCHWPHSWENCPTGESTYGQSRRQPRGGGCAQPRVGCTMLGTPCRVTDWFGLEGTSQIIQFQSPCHRLPHLPPDQAAQSPIQPGLGHCQGGGSHSFSGQPGPGPHHPHGEELLSYS